MKKILTILLALIVSISFISCREFIEEDILNSISESSTPSTSKSENTFTTQSTTSSKEESTNQSSITGDEYVNDESYTIIANTNTRKYHERNCRYIKKIKPENIIGFLTTIDAINNGYEACSVCFK